MLALEPAAGNPRPDSPRYQTPAAWTERDIHAALTPANPPHRSSKWLKSPTLCAWPPTGEQRGTRTGQSLSQTEHFLGCFLLATAGTDHFPRKLLRFLVLIFFFSPPIFIVRSELKWWHLAATFHQPYCYSLVVGICFPSGEMQRRCPCLEEHSVRDPWGNTSKCHARHYS